VLFCLCADLCRCTATRPPAATAQRYGDIFSETLDSDLNPAPLRDTPRLALLNFWAPWCASCVSELPSLQALHNRLRERGFSVIAVAVDTEESDLRASPILRRIDMPVVFDHKGVFKHAFSVGGLPESLLIDPRRGIVDFPNPDGGEMMNAYRGPARWDSPELVRYLSEYLDSYEERATSGPRAASIPRS
jgi:thiol-disulfide isomerase/thioredoxin